VDMSSLPPDSEAHRSSKPVSNEKPETDQDLSSEEALKAEAETPGTDETPAEEDKTVVPFLNGKAPDEKAGGEEGGEAPEVKLDPEETAEAKAPEPVAKQDPPMGSAAIGSALVPFVPRNTGEEVKAEAPARGGFLRSRAMQAAVLAAFVGLGWAAAGSFMGSHIPKPAPQQRSVAAVAATPAVVDAGAETKKLNDDVKALKKEVESLRAALGRKDSGDEIRSLKRSVESVKDGMESAKADVANSIAQLNGKVDRMQHDPGKLREINDRLDHIEKQAPVTTASIAPVQVETPKPAPIPLPPPKTAAVKPEAPVASPAAKPPAASPSAASDKPSQEKAASDKPQLLTNWVVRDVYRGVALVEGPHGSVEVIPGETIPGAGTVKSIEKRGGSWIVVTSRGLVDSARN